MNIINMTDMRREAEDIIDRHEIKGKRTSFINVLCKLQRGILIFGGVMFVIWFSISYGSQNYTNQSETVVAMKRTAPFGNRGMEDFREDILLTGMLKDHVIPHHYNLTLQLFMPPEYNFTTKGKVNILIECVKQTKMVVLHARDLTVEEANITYIDSFLTHPELPPQRTNLNVVPNKHLVFINFEEPLQKKKRYILDVTFSGVINNQSIGLYRSTYQLRDSNVSNWIASSQFQPSDARRVFPCFDEPGMKSTFEVHIIRKKDTVTLSNMPDQWTQALDDYWEVISFDLSPPMSTYLLAFVIGDVQPFSEHRNRGVQVWSRSDMSEYSEYAYHVTGDMFEFFSEYLEVPYSMPKTDLVAIPRFMHSAMENWGLITFAESALLYDPERSTTESKVFVTIVIAHELAHQWFGNLVTPAWWDHLWLNEGFASYYEYICIDNLRPEWNITYHFIGTIYAVMESDSLASTRAMSAPVSANNVLEYFDEISYLKGAAIVHMLQHFLGERNFRKGLKNYLWKYSFKNAKENDLWQNLNLWNRNEIGVKQVMKTWTNQPGYPVIKIVRNYSNRSATVTQKVFLLEPAEETFEEGLSVTGGKDTRTWIIPITHTNGKELDWSTKTDYWLKSVSGVMNDLPDERTWLLANIKQVGYYRVNYDVQNWEMLLMQLLDDHTVIHPINRAQIINDALNLARSDEVDYAIALNMTKYLYHEEDYLPWESAFSAFRYMDLMLSKTSAHKEWKEYVLTLMSPLYESLGWTNASSDDSLLTKYLRKQILKWSCNYGKKDCVKTAKLMFSDWRNGTTSNITMAVDDREVALCTGIAQGTIEDWEFMWIRYLSENFKGEQNILLKSLACTREIKLLEKLLIMALKPESGIALEDGSDVIVYVAENFHGRDIVYKFFKDNADDILLRFSAVPFAGSNIIDRLSAPLNTKNEVTELENMLRRRRFSTGEGARKSIKRGLQRAKSNFYWMQNKYEQVHTWLKENPIE